MAAVRHLGFYVSAIFVKNSNLRLDRRRTKFGKVGLSAVELLHIFDFQNGGRPPSWIWLDVIVDHPRLVFDGSNILLKLHVDHVNVVRDIAIFIFGTFGLKWLIHAHLWGVWGI